MPALKLSIVIPSYNAAATITQCLESILPQCDESTEVIVVDSGSDTVAELVSAGFPEVGLIRSEVRLYPGAARNLGVKHASGEILGFIDADCVAANEWVASVLSSHDKFEYPEIGGVIGVADAKRVLDWAAYFCSFYNWMPGTREGEVIDIPSCSLTVRRTAFDRFGPFRETGFSTDTEFNWSLVNAGYPLYLEPKIRVHHISHPGGRQFVQRGFKRGYAYSMMRQDIEGFSNPRRLLYLAGSPLIPFLFAIRLARGLARKGVPHDYRRAFLWSWPVVFLGFVCWGTGEALGYLRGKDHRARRPGSARSGLVTSGPKNS